MSYQSDEEQVQLLKNLWKDYGQPVLLGVVITLAGVSGYKYWQKNQQQEVAKASSLYQNLLETLAINEQNPFATVELTADQKATVAHITNTLQTDHASSQYAAMATLFLAQEQVQNNDLTAARGSLEWVLDHQPGPQVKVMASVRLARILLSESADNGQQALDILAKLKDTSAFEPTVESTRGDVYLALGDRKKAQEAYQKALDAAQAEGLNRPLLQLKLDDLVGLPPEPKDQSAPQEG